MPRELDEDDVRVRPGRGSRPRTRTRPEHGDAVAAMVVAVDRGRYTCRLDSTPGDWLVAAVRGGSMRRTSVVVGDRVALTGDVSAAPGSLARIVRREERTSVLRRTPDDTDPLERPIVANADQLMIVTALADPPPRTGLIDRCLVAAFDGGLRPLLCLTKGDLAEGPAAAELAAQYAPLGLWVGTTRPDAPLDDVAAVLAERTTVMFGHSGVGKSTLVNRLVPDADQAIGAVNAVTGRGRHTSSAALALPLPGAGWVIDTPGVRSFGLGAVSTERLLRAFPDLEPATADCQPGCGHLATDPDCALDALVAAGGASRARLDSLRRLLTARTTG